MSAYGFKWAADLASELSELPEVGEQEKSKLELFSVVVGTAITSLVASPAIFVAGFMWNEPVSLNTLIWGAAGGLIIGLGSIIWRMANLVASDLDFNVMNHLIPALAFIWLFVFSQVGDVSVEYLVIGVAVIIAANIGMGSVEREQPQESASPQPASR